MVLWNREVQPLQPGLSVEQESSLSLVISHLNQLLQVQMLSLGLFRCKAHLSKTIV